MKVLLRVAAILLFSYSAFAQAIETELDEFAKEYRQLAAENPGKYAPVLSSVCAQ